MTKEVVLYGNDICTYCTKAKEWLHEKGIQFTEKNIKIPEVKEEYESLNVQGVPYIIVKDLENNTQKSILGFSPQSLEEAIL
ncbi:NrdH-redoxin [Bacillus toyonensis]|nr:NrdH-redoxin [Bacillus toyonensis]PAW37789.1 NrdH-redoxin [Bacillus toyonensis]PAW43626.1 NrdH-redoxin [Bacillus toyonensis]PEX89836.1 NrdH-redoxin [Bacillus cereus]HEF1906399.1 glutaredoxin family protein [Bacillus cereus]